MRDGLRALEDREKLRELQLEALRAKVQRGADSGPGIAATTVFASVRKRIAGSSHGDPGPR